MMERVTNDRHGKTYAFRRGIIAGVNHALAHARNGATLEQLTAWRDEVETWAEGDKWPSPPPALPKDQGGEQ